MKFRTRLTKNTVIFGATVAWGLLLVSCVTASRTMLAPPQITGASFVGNKGCTECHAETVEHFGSATHASLAFPDSGVGAIGCEACHGPGSLHAKAGGTKSTIVNPQQSPEACFQCHLEKRGQFSLANSHGVMTGKMGCGDCHNPHEGDAIAGRGAALESQNETCTKCHTAQKGPFTFKHNAMREGCTACHNPHGTVNDKMLIARDGNLCLNCHLEVSTRPGIILAGGEDHRTRLQNGTCWSAGCHEAVHGSHTSPALRY